MALGQEIASFWEEQLSSATEHTLKRSLAVVLPSGTGTTALFLARYMARLNHDHAHHQVTVFAVPCCGSADYLQQQLVALDSHSGSQGTFPKILVPLEPATPPYHFGQASSALWGVYQELEGAGLTLDLLYGPRAWQLIFQHWGASPSSSAAAATASSSSSRLNDHTDMVYVHTGGLEGLPSQLARYRRLGLAKKPPDERY